MDANPKSYEVCFTPDLFQYKQTSSDHITVVVDVFRASTTICAALQAGVKKIYPVKSIEEATELKSKGYIVAGERNGKKLEIAAYGNSAYEFRLKKVPSELVLTTSNGTVAIQTAAGSGEVVVGSFCNIEVLTEWMKKQDKSIVILCSGWLGNFSMEDTLFAGALTESLMKKAMDFSLFDSAVVALKLWKDYKIKLTERAKQFEHYKRLITLNAERDAKLNLQFNTFTVIPYLVENYLEKLNLENS
jgi:2-phosphosulfolactate phosphatase